VPCWPATLPAADEPLPEKDQIHAQSAALFMTYYNSVRIHKTLRVTPALAAGVTDRLWEVSDIVALLEASEPKPGKHGPYKKRIGSVGL
jgi:hypothetical protein